MYEHIEIRKGLKLDFNRVKAMADPEMYSRPRNTQFLKDFENKAVEAGNMDPTAYYGLSNYDRYMMKKELKAKNGSAPLDLLGHVMKGFNLQTEGFRTSQIKAFISSHESKMWFPAVVSDKIYETMIERGLVEKMLPNIDIIDGWEFKQYFILDSAASRSMGELAPGEPIPMTQIGTEEKTNLLKKYGIGLKFEYEMVGNLTFQRFKTKFIERIGRQLANDKTARMFYVFINGAGDYTGLPAGNIATAVNSGYVESADITSLITECPVGYKVNMAAGSTTSIKKVWGVMSEFFNPAIQKAELGGGIIPIPEFERWDGDNLTANYVLAVDNQLAGMWVTNDDMVLEEQEQIMSNQTFNIYFTYRGDVALNDHDAIAALNIGS